MGFLSRLFGGGNKGTKKYEDIFFGAIKIGQSVEYAFRQAVDAAVNDKVFADRKEAAQKLYEAILPKAEPEHKNDLNRAVARIK